MVLSIQSFALYTAASQLVVAFPLSLCLGWVRIWDRLLPFPLTILILGLLYPSYNPNRNELWLIKYKTDTSPDLILVLLLRLSRVTPSGTNAIAGAGDAASSVVGPSCCFSANQPTLDD